MPRTVKGYKGHRELKAAGHPCLLLHYLVLPSTGYPPYKVSAFYWVPAILNECLLLGTRYPQSQVTSRPRPARSVIQTHLVLRFIPGQSQVASSMKGIASRLQRLVFPRLHRLSSAGTGTLPNGVTALRLPSFMDANAGTVDKWLKKEGPDRLPELSA